MNAMYISYRIGEFSAVPRTRIQTIELNNVARVYSALDSAWIKDIHFKDRCKADPLNSSDKCEQRDLFRIARRRSFSKLYFPFVIYLLLGPLVSSEPATLVGNSRPSSSESSQARLPVLSAPSPG